MKKTMLCATVLALSVAATGCASGKKAESSAASTAAAQSEAASTQAAGTAAETTAAAASDMAVPGYAPGQIPEIPAIVLPELGISENPAAKITLDKTKALSSVPGITVTPVRV